MAGARKTHNLVVSHLVRELGQQLRERPCRVYPSGMRVPVKSTGLYTYPMYPPFAASGVSSTVRPTRS